MCDRIFRRENAIGQLMCQKNEWVPYANAGRGEYEEYVVDNYTEPAELGLYGEDKNSSSREEIANRFNVMSGGRLEYQINTTIVPDSIEVTERPNGTFDATALTVTKDNYDQVKVFIGDVTGTDSTNQTARWNLTNVHQDVGGIYRFDDLDIAEVDTPKYVAPDRSRQQEELKH